MTLKYETTVYIDTSLEHHRHGSRHRIDGPAEIRRHTRSMFWYEYGKSHRIGGPSDVYIEGEGYYSVRGETYTKEEYDTKIRNLSKS